MNGAQPRFACGTVCAAAIFCCVYLQKFALPLGSSLQAPLLVPILWGMLLYLLISRQAFIDTTNALAFALFAIAVVMANLLGEAAFSPPSVLLLLTINAMLCVKIPIIERDYLALLQFFEYCMAGAMLIAVGQFLIQFAGRGMPGLNGHLPDWALLQFYNYVQPIHYGATLMKPNGVFFLETSNLAQCLGLALAVEAAIFKRTWVIGLFTAGVVISLGGTGMILVAVVIGWIALGQPRLMLQIGLLLLITLAIGFSYGLVDLLTARMSEFSDPNASASMRFVIPYMKMYDTITASLSRFLLGAGAGYLDRTTLSFLDDTKGFAWPSLAKIWVEEGFLSFLFYIVFLILTFFRRMPAPLLTSVCFTEYFFIAGSGLMQSWVVGLSLFLATAYVVTVPNEVPRSRLITRSSHRRLGSLAFLGKGAPT